MIRFLHLSIALVGIALLTLAQPRDTSAETPSGAYVVAVNNPLAYFAERLAGDAIEVRMPAPPGTDPAFWQPTVDDILLLQGAELIILNGAGYSPWLNKVSISRRSLVVTSSQESWIALEDQVTHSHGPQGEHAHGGYAGTTWMDLLLAATQAEAVANALATLLPEQAPEIDARLAELRNELATLDGEMKQCAAQLVDRQLIYSHPVYQYFERRYGLPGASLHWEPDSMPSEEQWRKLESALGDDALFIWEAEPEEAIAARMASMNLAFVVIDPAANSSEGDWMSVQQGNLLRLQAHCATDDG